ncbi:WcaF family extracellular polysaccharide biosynthesis acetyltransferase [Pedobacter frigiditerrae]|uniref:WcaF family extracellular polysaccharide biosynthesis acetyltransferase n=1 Tax=Pedobacter frigiditerrae TaxID=2530452 RepID=UPI002931D62B|nr:WcaF family extracellular polysaccharide biosynthesis acetyltransferase [Pedobacter frigiditerrae]
MKSELINVDTHTGASFSFKNRFARVIWSVVYQILFRFSPKPLHGWRSFLLKLFGAKVGKGVHIYPGVRIWAPWNLELHDQCGVGSGANLYSQGKITIGEKAVISQGAYLCAGTHDYTKAGFPLITAPIYIGKNVWVAAEAFVHPGVAIGEGTVVGARAVVVKDLPAWMVFAGNPARPIKDRVITDLPI